MTASDNQRRLAEIARALYGERWQLPLARDLGVAQTMTARWASGKYAPSDERLAQVRELARKRIEQIKKAAK